MEINFSRSFHKKSVRVAARSKAWVYGSSFAGVAGSNPARYFNVFGSVVSIQIEVSASG